MASDPERFENPQFSNLAEQLQALATELRGASRSTAGQGVSAQILPFRGDETERFASFAKSRYDARRLRSAIFGQGDLFGEPAWDILLDLYIAHTQGKRVSVSSACIGSASPPTTGLRWLGILQEAGLVEREHDPCDQRRVLVQLSSQAIERMENFFREALAIEEGRDSA